VYLNSTSSSEENVPGGHTRIFTDSERSLKVTKHLGGETVQRRHIEDRVVEDSCRALPGGH
jgi:hypothetical protein